MADEPAPYRSDSAPKGKTSPPPASKSPLGRGQGKTKAATPKRDLMSIPDLNESLKDKWTYLGMAAYKFNEVDGLILLGGTDDVIDSFTELAERNIRVRRVLDKIANTGEGIGIAFPLFNMANAIAANHGISTGVPLLVSIESYAAKAESHVDLADEPSDYDESMDDDLPATAAT